MLRNVTVVALMGLLLGSLTGCSFSGATETPQPKWTQTEILFDHTISMRPYQREELADVATAFRAMAGAGETEVCIINANPLAFSPVASVRVRPFDPAKETEDFYRVDTQDVLKREVPKVLNELETTLKETPFANATAIIDSLALAQRRLRAVPVTPARKRIAVISDLVEDSGGIRLERERLTPQRRQELVARIKAEGRLPDLRDVEVFVSGARIHPEMPRIQADAIENFWIELLDATGANVHRETFMPTLRESLLSHGQ